MKFKLIIWPILLLLSSSCVGSDTAFLPDSITKAKEENLLINVYQPNKRIVKVDNVEYNIDEAFTTTKFNSTSDKTINKNVLVFILKLKNKNTGKPLESDNELADFHDYINFNSETGGIQDSNLSVSFKSLEMRNQIDTIKIGFLDHDKIEDEVIFIKK